MLSHHSKSSPTPLDGRSGLAKRKSGRLTPYSSSFHAHRRKAGNDDPGNEENPSNPLNSEGRRKVRCEVIKNLVSKSCHVYQLSPLWKFESTRQALRRYCEHLTSLLRTLSKTGGQGKQRSNSYVGVVKVVEDFDPDGSYCVEVTVRCKSSSVGAPEGGLLMCRIGQSPDIEKGFTYLPLMLVYGLTTIGQVILDWVKSSFDCCIRTASVDHSCLHSIAANYATTVVSSSKKKTPTGLILVYNLPESVRKAGLTSITLDIPHGSIPTLASSGNSIDHTLEGLILEQFHLKLSSLSLVAVSTQTLQISCQKSCTAKFFSASHVIPIIGLIQQALALL